MKAGDFYFYPNSFTAFSRSSRIKNMLRADVLALTALYTQLCLAVKVGITALCAPFIIKHRILVHQGKVCGNVYPAGQGMQ